MGNNNAFELTFKGSPGAAKAVLPHVQFIHQTVKEYVRDHSDGRELRIQKATYLTNR